MQSAQAAPPTNAPADQAAPPASIQWLVAGNAAQRILLADAFAWQPAQDASGASWARPALERLARDPYAAVRFVARRSLRTIEAHEKGPAPRSSAPRLSAELLDALTAQRNDEPITISE
jgi:hypothetical protein